MTIVLKLWEMFMVKARFPIKSFIIFLFAHIVQLNRTPDYGSEDMSLNLFEGTKLKFASVNKVCLS